MSDAHDPIDAFWDRARSAGAVPADATPTLVERFGDSPALADELLGFVIHGDKRATTGSHDVALAADGPMPFVGMFSVMLDGADRPRVVLRTTEVRVGPMSSVDDRFAWDEGEGDRSRETWLADHTAFFSRQLTAIGLEFHPDIPVVFERFELVYAESPDD